MAEFKQVFNFVSDEVISQGFSFDQLIAWLGTRREAGQALENWTLDEVKPHVAMWKAMKLMDGNQENNKIREQGSPSRHRLEEGDLEEDFSMPGEGFKDQGNTDFDSNPLRVVE